MTLVPVILEGSRWDQSRPGDLRDVIFLRLIWRLNLVLTPSAQPRPLQFSSSSSSLDFHWGFRKPRASGDHAIARGIGGQGGGRESTPLSAFFVFIYSFVILGRVVSNLWDQKNNLPVKTSPYHYCHRHHRRCRRVGE